MSFRFGNFSPLGNIRELFSFEVWDGIRKRGTQFLGTENVFFSPSKEERGSRNPLSPSHLCVRAQGLYGTLIQ